MKQLFRPLLLIVLLIIPSLSQAQEVAPKAYYTDNVGTVHETDSINNGQAPLVVDFRANPSKMDDYEAAYEWHFKKADAESGTTELLVRYEEDTQYTFNESGTFYIELRVLLTKNGETSELPRKTITVVISESKLEFPNAFSPNDDGINDVYMAKKGYKSIVEFHAYIFNRWGQKLYDWTDVSKGWDGTHNGHPVKDGVYFVLVKARGADGREYNIRRDVNLLRGLNKNNSSSSSSSSTE